MEDDSMPQNAILLVRLSPIPGEWEEGAENQEKRLRRRAELIGWKIGPAGTHVLIESQTSAYKRKPVLLPDGRTELRTIRPKFRLALDMLYDGRADGLIVDDLDRVARDARDLQDLIDVAEQRRMPVTAVSGKIDLSSDAGILAASVNVAVANKSSRDTARRVANGHRASAERGRPRAGGRYPPYGYERGFTRDGEPTLFIAEDEAAEICRWADAILGKSSLSWIARNANTRGVLTHSGTSKWQGTTIRQILRNPRIAGIAVHKGFETKGNWEAIIPDEKWRDVIRELSDPARKRGTTAPWSKAKNRGRPPVRLGSHIYRCGVEGCDQTLVSGGYGKYSAYVCPDGGIARKGAPVDELVTHRVTSWLSQPEAAFLLTQRDTGDLEAKLLHDESIRLRLRDAEVWSLYKAKTITADELREERSELSEQIAAVDDKLAAIGRAGIFDGIAGRPDAAEIWEGLSPERKRAIIKELVEVTILPVGPGSHYFDPHKVSIVFREEPPRKGDRRKRVRS
jgi:site-specific DNA recombinase